MEIAGVYFREGDGRFKGKCLHLPVSLELNIHLGTFEVSSLGQGRFRGRNML